MRMRRDRCQLLIIDVQERLAPYVESQDEVVANARRLLGYADRLGVPTTLTEHYPKGLGPTVPGLREAAGSRTPVLEKIDFSCWQDFGIRQRIERLAAAGRDQIVVAGMEAHVCVGQTVLDLVAEGFEVFVAADAVGSRQARTRDIAVERLRQAGATIVAQEMVAFEWLERGDAPEFKDVIGLVK
jgi:nicotinamidase-related amidase